LHHESSYGLPDIQENSELSLGLPDIQGTIETEYIIEENLVNQVPEGNDVQEGRMVFFSTQIDESDTSTTEIENQLLCLNHLSLSELPGIQESSETDGSIDTDLVEISSVESEDTSITDIQDELSKHEFQNVKLREAITSTQDDFSEHEFQKIKRELSSFPIAESDTASTIEIEEYSEYEVESDEDYEDESYYSEDSGEEEMELEGYFEGLLQEMKAIHSENIAKTERRLSNSSLIIEEVFEGSEYDSIEEIIEESMNGSMSLNDGSYSSYAYESLSSSIAFSTHLTVEDEQHTLRIGVVAPAVRAMLIQARLEWRSRKVPEEHISNFKPALGQASFVGRTLRLDEYIVEAWGKNYTKYDSLKLPSLIWRRGEETVFLPNLHDPTRPQFTIFKEAVALGGIKALKPKITTNYDNWLPTESYDDEEVDIEIDIDDVTKHKRIRTKYLTDRYLHQDHVDRERDFYDDDDIDPIHYSSLDDVELPTEQCPVIVCTTNRMTTQELREALAQQVAEAVWDRRYRLERPLARQRIKYRCTCKYCRNSNPYQTVAYRKRWLIEQNLLKEPAVIETIEETNLKETSNRTASTRKSSIDEHNNSDPECEVVEIFDGVLKETGNDCDTPQSLSSEGEEFFECTEHGDKSSVIMEMGEDRFESPPEPLKPTTTEEKDSEDSDSEFQSTTMSLSSTSFAVPAVEEKGAKAKNKKRFMREIQSALGMSQHKNSNEQIGSKKPVQDKKIPNKNKRSLKKGIKSFFSHSSHHKGTRYARAA